MSRFSLRTLLVGVTIAALCLWVFTVPRGNITPSAARMLKSGMTLDEASAIIGVEPGWHDGIYGLSGDVDLGDKGNPVVSWVNLHGAITTEVTGRYDNFRIVNVQFTPPSEFTARFRFPEMLYDRTLKPLVDSHSPAATFCILLGCLLFPLLPSVVLGAFTGVKLARLAGTGILIGSIAYAVMAVSLNTLWLGHHDTHFGMIAKAISSSVFVVTVLLACLGRVFARSDIASVNQSELVDGNETLAREATSIPTKGSGK